MGFLDVLLGRSRLRRSRPEGVFAIATAAVILQEQLGLEPAGKAAVVFGSVDSTFFEAAQRELEEILGLSEKAAKSRIQVTHDDYGYQWVVVEDPEFEDLVTALHLVAQTLEHHGFQDRLLAAVFPYRREGERLYWLYSYKSGKYYPFAPKPEQRERNVELEVRMAAAARRELPVEQDSTLWYGLYGAPL